MKILNALIIAIACIVSQPIFANEEAKQEAEALLNIMGMEQALNQSIEQMLQVQLQQNPAMVPYKNVMKDFFSKHMSYESLKSDIITIYAEAFTAKELREINAFYRTPVGRKTIEVMPKIMGQGAQIGAKRVQANIAELQQMIKAESERLQQIESK